MDERTIQHVGVPGIALMEVAGKGASDALLAWWSRRNGPQTGGRVLIFCGGGNNGGDGYVMARHLLAAGHAPVLALLAAPEVLKGDAKIAFQAATASGIEVVRLDRAAISDDTAWEAALGALIKQPWDGWVDALFGTGLTKPVTGREARILGALSSQSGVKVALDIPSGLDAESGQALAGGAVMRADLTVTFGCSKPGLHLLPGREWAGEVVVIDLGFSPNTFAEVGVRGEALTRDMLIPWMKPRRRDTHKGTFGRVLVLGGSPGMLGAAVLAGSAALRVGAGLVTVGTRRGLDVSQIAAEQWELMGAPLLPDADMTERDEAALLQAISTADVVAMGPGMGTRQGIVEALRVVMERFEGALVLDADALNILALQGRTEWLSARSQRGALTILTPHLGEQARLVGTTNQEVQTHRLAIARESAARWGSVVVLKSGSTVVASPRGPYAINTTGTPGMASAGMGDVLTGMIAGLLGQGLSAWDAARVGVCLHGLAGQEAEHTHGQRALTAKALLGALPALIAQLEREAAAPARSIG